MTSWGLACRRSSAAAPSPQPVMPESVRTSTRVAVRVEVQLRDQPKRSLRGADSLWIWTLVMRMTEVMLSSIWHLEVCTVTAYACARSDSKGWKFHRDEAHERR